MPKSRLPGRGFGERVGAVVMMIVALLSWGTAHVTGSTSSPNFPTPPTAFHTSSGNEVYALAAQFAPVAPCTAFSPSLAVNNSKGQFGLVGKFTLGTGGACCDTDPLADVVTLQIADFSITIPANSFKRDVHGNYAYSGTINGVHLVAAIRPQSGNPNAFSYGFEGQGASNLPTTNPVRVRLTVGNNPEFSFWCLRSFHRRTLPGLFPITVLAVSHESPLAPS